MKKGNLLIPVFLLLQSAFCVLHSSEYELVFPRDHGAHQDARTEWWYYTGHLQTEGGHRYGFEVTFFRVGVVPPGTPGLRWTSRESRPRRSKPARWT